ncbi:MAG: DnaA N-terminal domain-containing protein [Alphaproteobacteria bacterium]|nr:DnaA N-terminal domain-containing protein [Alphaproteobacteria bacterium]
MQNHTLIAQADLIKEFGRVGAQLINQIHYWLEKNKVGTYYDGKKWVYNTAEEWAKQILVSSRTIERYINFFVKNGIVQVAKLNPHKSNRTNYLTLNYEKLQDLKPKNHDLNTKKSTPQSLENNDKVSEPPRQNVGMVIQKNTNKDLNNKSEKMINDSLTPKQVQQVKNKNIKINEIRGKSKHIAPQTTDLSLINSTMTLKNTTIQDMLALWNKTFPNATTKMSKNLAPLLMATFKQKCDSNMKVWENYLQRIQSSYYLTDKTFHLSLDWALKFRTLDRIFKGELGVKDIPVQLDQKTEEGRALDHIQEVAPSEPEACHSIRLLLLQKLGAYAYNAWFTKVVFVQQNGTFRLKAENKFVEDYVLQHYGDLFTL